MSRGGLVVFLTIMTSGHRVVTLSFLLKGKGASLAFRAVRVGVLVDDDDDDDVHMSRLIDSGLGVQSVAIRPSANPM